jgi:tetraacyldisaccharide 4'-kinase
MSLELDPYSLDLENLVLSPLGALYFVGWKGYEATYKLGFKKPYLSKVPVVCVGNLIVGGSGKSPTVLAMLGYLRRLGNPVIVGCSGYGSPASKDATIAPTGALDPAKWGDEPAMLRWLDPDVPLVIGRNRVLAAKLVEQEFPDHILLMDDGLQHKPLKKDLSILLDPPYVRNAMCLPSGPYREPRSNRSRFDLLLPGERFDLNRESLGFFSPELDSVNLPKEMAIQTITAIARAWRFQRALEGLGMHVIGGIMRRDHDPLTEPNLFSSLDPKIPIVCTAKDWVKLRQHPARTAYHFYILREKVTITPEDTFLQYLTERLNEIRTAKKS